MNDEVFQTILDYHFPEVATSKRPTVSLDHTVETSKITAMVDDANFRFTVEMKAFDFFIEECEKVGVFGYVAPDMEIYYA